MDHQGLLAGNGDMIKDVFEADLAAKLAGVDGDVEAWDAAVHGAGQKLFLCEMDKVEERCKGKMKENTFIYR